MRAEWPGMRAVLLAAVAAVLLLAGGRAVAGEKGEPGPGPKEKCPVCGMFVAKFPDFLAEVRFADGTRAWFDGPKDLFRFLRDRKRFDPAKSPPAVESAWVKDYYTLSFIDAGKAFFVSGSDVYGPMGKELIPFGKEEEAREFLADHKGKAIHRFREVTPEVLRGLE